MIAQQNNETCPRKLDASAQPESVVTLDFPNWNPKNLGSSIVQMEQAWHPYLPLRAYEFLQNASDSIVFSGKAQNGHITVTVIKGNTLKVIVEDNGEGVPPEMQPHLFRRDFRVCVPSQMQKNHRQIIGDIRDIRGGGGNGLAFLGEDVARLGGSVGFQSKGPGMGAIFWMEVPVSRLSKV